MQKIRMSMKTMKQQRKKKMNCCLGEKLHQNTKRRNLKGQRLLRKTQMKRKRQAKRGTLSYVCSPEAPVGGPAALCSCLEIQVWGNVFLWDFRSSCLMKVRHIVKMMCIAFRNWRIYWSHHFNSTCALNSGLKEGCATQSKERSCSWQQGRELEKNGGSGQEETATAKIPF